MSNITIKLITNRIQTLQSELKRLDDYEPEFAGEITFINSDKENINNDIEQLRADLKLILSK